MGHAPGHAVASILDYKKKKKERGRASWRVQVSKGGSFRATRGGELKKLEGPHERGKGLFAKGLP